MLITTSACLLIPSLKRGVGGGWSGEEISPNCLCCTEWVSKWKGRMLVLYIAKIPNFLLLLHPYFWINLSPSYSPAWLNKNLYSPGSPWRCQMWACFQIHMKRKTSPYWWESLKSKIPINNLCLLDPPLGLCMQFWKTAERLALTLSKMSLGFQLLPSYFVSFEWGKGRMNCSKLNKDDQEGALKIKLLGKRTDEQELPRPHDQVLQQM